MDDFYKAPEKPLTRSDLPSLKNHTQDDDPKFTVNKKMTIGKTHTQDDDPKFTVNKKMTIGKKTYTR